MKLVLILFIGLVSWECLSTPISFNYKRVELSSVHYLQDDGNTHSAQLSWAPGLLSLSEKWKIFPRIGLGHINTVDKGKIWTAHFDVVGSYEVLSSSVLEGSIGVEDWEDSDTSLKLGVAYGRNVSDIGFLKFAQNYLKQILVGYSYIDSDVETNVFNIVGRFSF